MLIHQCLPAVVLIGALIVQMDEIKSSLNLRLEAIEEDMGKPTSNWTDENIAAAEIFAKWQCCFKQGRTGSTALLKENTICCPSGVLHLLSLATPCISSY